MPTELVRRIVEDPAYAELHRKRTRLAWALTLAMLVIYYGFILLIAFSPKTLAIRIGDGATTLGFPLGAAVIVSAVILTGIYVWKANSEFDRLNEQLRRHLKS
jgi:uncharacterized membrane protein (DUF485 family)